MKKQKKHEFEESRECYQLLIRASLDGIWDWQLESNELYLSPRWKDQLGFLDQELENNHNNWIDRFHPDDRLKVTSQLSSFKKNPGLHWQGEFRLRHKNGTYLWMFIRGVPLLDDSGNVVRIFGIQTDIDSRKKIEKTLLEKEQIYRLLVENQTDLIVKVDLQGRFQFVSQSYCKIFAKEEKELLGNSFMPLVHEDDRENTARAMTAIFEPPYKAYIEQRAMTKDGWRWFGWMDTAVLDDDNNVIAIIGVGRDITETKLAEIALRYERNFLSDLIDTAPVIILILDEKGKIVRFNSFMEKLSGYTLDEVQGKDWFSTFIPEKQNQKIKSVFQKSISGKNIWGNINPILTKQGGERLIEWFDHKLSDEDGIDTGILAIGLDITEKNIVEGNLNIFKSFSETSSQGLGWATIEGVIEYSNKALAEMIGEKDRNALTGQNVITRYYPAVEQSRLKKEIFPCIIKDGRWSGELMMQHISGKLIPTHNSLFLIRNEDSTPLYIANIINDISIHKEYENHLKHIAHHDPLTNLPNRVLLADRLHQAMIQEKRRGQYLAVVYLDLDGFKRINDTQGHDVGDQLLIQLTKHLRNILREGDTIARMGGDEFVAVLVDLSEKNNCLALLERFLSATSDPISMDESILQVSASLGVTFYPQVEDIDAEQLIRQADQAMYQAKLSGKNRYHIFDSKQDKSLRGHHEKLERIHQGMMDNEFVLYYQPKVNMRSGEIIGVEALIRWQHPEDGLLSPAHFLPIIENELLSVELGYWVITTALSALKTWHQSGLEIPVSVNISALHLQQTDFVERLESILAAYPEIDNHYLELEILETSALADIDLASKVMHACHQIGVDFALDDFGTGYSSLSYLKRLPISMIKIDQTFVRDMLYDPEDLAILEGIMSLSLAFRRQYIAEGVESIEHGELLLQMGCELAQGYGIARPMAAEKFPAWVTQWIPALLWQNIQAVSRNDLPLLYSRVEIYAWVHEIETCIREKRQPPKLSVTECRFGQWFYSEGKDRYSIFASFHDIETLHKKMHQLGKQLCVQIKQNNKKKIAARLAEIHEFRDKLLHQLKKLLRESQSNK